MSITVRGVEEVDQELRRWASDLDDLPALSEVGDLLDSAVRDEAPVLSGFLRDTTDIEVGPGTASVAVTADYAAPVIGGVPSRGIDPDPFPARAMYAREGDVIGLVEGGITDSIEAAGLD